MSSTSMPLIRPLALPIEHGGWALLLEPIVLGLIVAPSIPGSLISYGAVAIFQLRQPLRLAAYDWTRLNRLASYGIAPGSEVRLVSRRPAVVIECGSACVALEDDIAQEIYIAAGQ